MEQELQEKIKNIESGFQKLKPFFDLKKYEKEIKVDQDILKKYKNEEVSIYPV